MEAAYLFDKVTTNSILGVRTYNSFKATFYDNDIVIGKNKVELPLDLKSKLLPTAFGKELQLVANVNEISINPIEDSVKLPIKIAFTEEKTDYIAAFFKVEGLDEYFVMKLRLDQPANVDCIYLPIKNMKIYDENRDLVKSHEIVYSNSAPGHAFRRNDELFVKAFGTTLKVKDREEFASIDGPCMVEISPENAVVILSKKLLKEKLASDPANAALAEAKEDAKLASRIIQKTEKALLKADESNKEFLEKKLAEANEDLANAQSRIGSITEYLNKLHDELFAQKPELKTNLITFTAYDEDKSSNKNFIYGVVNGVENYATFHVENNFSVYAMDKFKIHIPEDSIILK